MSRAKEFLPKTLCAIRISTICLNILSLEFTCVALPCPALALALALALRFVTLLPFILKYVLLVYSLSV